MIKVGDAVWITSLCQSATIVRRMVGKDGKVMYTIRVGTTEITVAEDDIIPFVFDADALHRELIEEFESTM